MPHVSAILAHRSPNGAIGWLRLRRPVRTVAAHRAADVLPALAEVQQAVDRGLFGAGFLAYEAAAGVSSHFETHLPVAGLPLVWFGLFESSDTFDQLPECGGDFTLGRWQPNISPQQHRQAVGRIKDYIAAGDTYQVNYTFQLRADFRGDPQALFARLAAAQPSPHAAFIDAGDFALCSASPELFFELAGGVVTTKPMKGTAPRGRTGEEDHAFRSGLAGCPKNRAENAMIVDMMRNDIGRIAEVGSVVVSDLFAVEQHPTLFQMTSTVTARVAAPPVEVLRALFPCASITGAPKVRTMQIIRELESAPRGPYTGCIGLIAPGGRARFNVAIRTVAVDRRAGRACYGTGGGIVWDSKAADEYAECLTKSAILRQI